MNDLVAGIDLGTTNSLIGAVVDGEVRLFADDGGQELLPSVVGGAQGGGVLVGRAAKNQRLLDPAGTVVSVKRLMGTDRRLRVGEREVSPVQVSALILGALLDRAGKALGQRPGRAVITVPAYFDDAQRQATRDAGEVAGLHVERLVNEPTAAALTYHTGAEQLVLVYDLGGGTFDVSILEREEGFLEVRSSRGDTRLGGDDVDQALTRLVLERLGSAGAAIERDLRAMTRLVEAVERAKVALSDREEVRLFDPFLSGEGGSNVHLDLPLSRKDVSVVAHPLVERTLACIDDALRDAGAQASDLDRVLLVGGASRMPIVRTLVAAHLGRPVQQDLDADRAVALGASLLAGRIAGAPVAEVLVDITPHTLSVGAVGEETETEDEDDLIAVPVIPRDTVVPVERKTTVHTRIDDQPRAELPIVQGEQHRIGGNTRLGTVAVTHIPPSPRGSPVEVTFRLDLSGVLHVSAEHVPSGRSAEVCITDSPYSLTGQRRDRARAEVEDLRALPGSVPDAVTDGDLSMANALLARARRALERDGADPTDRDRLRKIAATLAEAVAARDPELVQLTDELTDALLDLV